MEPIASWSKSADLCALCRPHVRRPGHCIAIIAGHYCIAPELSDLSYDGEAEQQSFAAGVKLRGDLSARGLDAPLILWVNDIGVPPDQRHQLKQTYALPEPYADIWSSANSDETGLIVWFESTMRNNASTFVRRLAKERPSLFTLLAGDDPSLVRCVDDERCTISRAQTSVYTVPGPRGERLVVKDGPNPKCNLILATLYRSIQERLGAVLTVSIFNELYRNRIRLGMHVAQTIADVRTEMLTAFCDGSNLLFEPSLSA